MHYMQYSSIATLRHRAIIAMREAGKPRMPVNELAARLGINRPDFTEALIEAGFVIIQS